MTFKFPVTWEMCGEISINADTLSAALVEFNKISDDLPLPAEQTYVDGSFVLTTTDPEELMAYQKKLQ